MKKQGVSRRTFLHSSGGVLSGAWLASQWPGILLAAEKAGTDMASEAAWSVLSTEEAASLGAIADRIFPPDETPGASEIGAVHFMDRAFGGFMAGAWPMMRSGLEDLERLARATSDDAPAFARLDAVTQDGLLKQVEQTPFFGTVHFLTLCGLFTLPAYGGNRDRLGWQLLGFEARHAWQPPFGHYDADSAGEVSHDV